jgi:hypothetical protein
MLTIGLCPAEQRYSPEHRRLPFWNRWSVGHRLGKSAPCSQSDSDKVHADAARFLLQSNETRSQRVYSSPGGHGHASFVLVSVSLLQKVLFMPYPLTFRLGPADRRYHPEHRRLPFWNRWSVERRFGKSVPCSKGGGDSMRADVACFLLQPNKIAMDACDSVSAVDGQMVIVDVILSFFQKVSVSE